MDKRIYPTPKGDIVYRISGLVDSGRPWLVFLPGLTADHRLFEKQIEHFAPKMNVLAWDPPSHGESRPFDLDWSLDDLARWLHGILAQEGIEHPVLIGQSMGGYTAQAFMEFYPGEAAGFVSIDSCPLKRAYYAGWELAALRHTKLMFRMFPWKTLVNLGSSNNATSEYGRNAMREMMLSFDKREYCDLSAHGFRILADAVATIVRMRSSVRSCSSAGRKITRALPNATTGSGKSVQDARCIGLKARAITQIAIRPIT